MSTHAASLPPIPDVPPKRLREDFQDEASFEAYRTRRRKAQKAVQDRSRPARDRVGRARPARDKLQAQRAEERERRAAAEAAAEAAARDEDRERRAAAEAVALAERRQAEQQQQQDRKAAVAARKLQASRLRMQYPHELPVLEENSRVWTCDRLRPATITAVQTVRNPRGFLVQRYTVVWDSSLRRREECPAFNVERVYDRREIVPMSLCDI